MKKKIFFIGLILFHRLSLYKEVLSGGVYLNNIGKPVDGNKTMDWLSQCKFVISYENQSHPGYITEKVPNAYLAGAVPIYNGHPSVLADINKDSVIYSGDFENDEALVEYIKKVDNDDDLYCNIWREKMFDTEERSYEHKKQEFVAKLIPIIDAKLKERNANH